MVRFDTPAPHASRVMLNSLLSILFSLSIILKGQQVQRPRAQVHAIVSVRACVQCELSWTRLGLRTHTHSSGTPIPFHAQEFVCLRAVALAVAQVLPNVRLLLRQLHWWEGELEVRPQVAIDKDVRARRHCYSRLPRHIGVWWWFKAHNGAKACQNQHTCNTACIVLRPPPPTVPV